MLSKTHYVVFLVVGIIALQAIALFLMGQPLLCNCGYIKFWDASLKDADNSQHFFDVYSFEHFAYGFVFYFLMWLVRKKFPFPLWVALLTIVAISAGWEIFENTYYVNKEYQAGNIFENYAGDSLLNSVIDTMMLLFGFWLARILPFWASIGIIVCHEIILTLTIHHGIVMNLIIFLKYIIH